MIFFNIKKKYYLDFCFFTISAPCEIKIALNIITQPEISRAESLSPSKRADDKTAKTLSMHIKSEPRAESHERWPKIWQVYATPQLITPEYKSGTAADFMSLKFGFSKISIKTQEIIPEVKN